MGITQAAMDLTALPDGIQVRTTGLLQAEEGLWTLVVQIDEPVAVYGDDRDKLVSEQAERLKETVAGFSEGSFITPEMREALLSRVGLLCKQPARKKRGLIDGIGWGLQWAFGTATESEVVELKEAIDTLHQEDGVIVNKVNRMMTFVNKTREVVGDNRERLNELIAAYNDFAETMESITKDGVQIMVTNMLLTYLEVANQETQRARSRLRREQLALSQGRLSPDLLSEDALEDIRDRVSEMGLVPLDPGWYYTYANIVPLYQHGPTIIYRALLPLVGRDQYQAYGLQSWPVPKDGRMRRLVLTKDVAVHALTGRMFIPHSCIGNNPKVCRTGPLASQGKWACERGLITGHEPDRRECIAEQVDVREATTVVEMERGEYVLITTGETYTLSCEGARQIKDELPLGTWHLQLGGRCELSMDNWTLAGEILKFGNLSTRHDLLPIKPFDWNGVTRTGILDMAGGIPTLGPLPTDRLPPRLPEPPGVDFGHVTKHAIWAVLGIIVVAATVGSLCWWRRSVRRRSRRPRDEPCRGISMVELGPRPEGEAEVDRVEGQNHQSPNRHINI